MCEVVTARKQCAPSLVSPNTRLRNVEAWSQAVTIAIESERNWALPAGERTEIGPGASHFLAHDITSPTWPNAYQVPTIGGHTFPQVQDPNPRQGDVHHGCAATSPDATFQPTDCTNTTTT